MSTLAENTKTQAFVPGPGGFATSVPLARPAGPPGRTFPVPRPSAGLRLHGEYQGSGSIEPKFIARRGDGQVVQLSRLLHLVAGSVDAGRDTEEISHRVSARFGREVSEENILFLIDQKLIPMGVVVPWDQEDDEVEAPASDLLLALKGHRVLFNEDRVNRIGRALAWLHRPPVVTLVLLSAVAMDVWLFGFYGAITPVLNVLNQPVLMLAVFGLTVASLVFHEFGHASACRYGGARPGCIGCGLYLVWPSMYTEVTDVYRISRPGRIRTDLGGIYFNVVFMLMLTGCYFLTGQPFLLSAVYLGHFEVLEQLMPAVRLDGYYILGDLAGVPDLFGKIKPILRSMVPGKPTPPEVSDLKRSARIIVSVWVLAMVPLLLGDLGYALWNLPRLLSTGARSLTEQLEGTGSAFLHGEIAAGLMGVIGSVMLVCPLAGMLYLAVRMTGRLIRTLRRTSDGNPKLRIAFCGMGAVLVAGLCFAWVVGLTPKPVPQQPPMVPVLQPGVTAVAAPPSSSNSPGSTGTPSPGQTSNGVQPGSGNSPTSIPSGVLGAGSSAGATAGSPAATGQAAVSTASGTAPAPSKSPAPSSSSGTSASPTTGGTITSAPTTTAPTTPPASSPPPASSAPPSGSTPSS
jgi:putative peptide zinc metalloprotease protein